MVQLDALHNYHRANYFVRMKWMLLLQQTRDLVIVTGVHCGAREFFGWGAQELLITARFARRGVYEVTFVDKIQGCNALTLQVVQSIVKIDLRYFRPTEAKAMLGDPSKTKAELGWTREVNVQQMCNEIASADLQAVKLRALLKVNGYQVNVSLE